MRRVATALVTLLVVASAAACSSGGGSGSAGQTPDDTAGAAQTSGSAASSVTIGWVFDGAADADAVSAIESAFPGQVTSLVAEGAGDQPGAAAQGLVTQGATLVVSEAPGACAQVADVHCVELGATSAPGANAVAIDGTFWNRAYLLGRAAGLLTETDVVGYVAAGDSPVDTAAVNAWALGCQSANPNCVVRLVVSPQNPAKALKHLIKQHVDVIGSALVDADLCEAAGDVPVQPVLELGDPCGTAFAPTTLATAIQPLVQAELDGSWQGGRQLAVDVATWSTAVSQDVAAKVEARAKEIDAGRNVFTGPLFDNAGSQRLPKGQELPADFIASQWTWLLGGVLAD